MLLFKKKFLPAIRAGEKTQTIRLWKHRHMRAGQRSYIPGAGHIRVVAVDEVELAQLTDADARPDGFETIEELRAEISRFYAKQLAAGYQAYRIRFQLCPKGEGNDEGRKSKVEGMAKDESQMTKEGEPPVFDI